MSGYLKKHTLIAKALLLTATGFASRILGFFYRIFLSRTIGAEGLGIYQMIFPIFGICFSLCAGSIQTAISQFTASRQGQGKKALLSGFLISLSLSLSLAALIIRFSDFLAVHILSEPRCASLLPVMALSLPCTAVHASISGYYYGKEKVHIPAAAQLVEQCIRIFTVCLVVSIFKEQGRPVTVLVAVIGLTAGEAGSAIFCLLSFLLCGRKCQEDAKNRHKGGVSEKAPLSYAAPIMALALPLMASRLVMNLLQSAESILIPSRLGMSGLSQAQSLGIYGTLTGMAMPFIMFPTAIVNSLAVILLPTVARHQSAGNRTGIADSISMSFRYSLYMGILCVGIFTVFGKDLGEQVFKSANAGAFISVLAWLCPFLYIATTMGSILNGLGKTSVTFFHNLISLLIRLCFVLFGIPRFGIRACLWGILGGELALSLLHLASLRRETAYSPNVWETVVKPTFCLFTAMGIYRLFPETLPFSAALPPLFATAVQILIVCSAYALLLLLFHREKERA